MPPGPDCLRLTSYLSPARLLCSRHTTFLHALMSSCFPPKDPCTCDCLFLNSVPGFFMTDSFRPQLSKATSSVKLFLTTSLQDTSLFHFLQDTHSNTVWFCLFTCLLSVSPLEHKILKGSHLCLIHCRPLRAMNGTWHTQGAQ